VGKRSSWDIPGVMTIQGYPHLVLTKKKVERREHEKNMAVERRVQKRLLVFKRDEGNDGPMLKLGGGEARRAKGGTGGGDEEKTVSRKDLTLTSRWNKKGEDRASGGQKEGIQRRSRNKSKKDLGG